MPAKKKVSARASTARTTTRRVKPAARRRTTRSSPVPRLRSRKSAASDELEPLQLTSDEDRPEESGPLVLGGTAGDAGDAEVQGPAILGEPAEGAEATPPEGPSEETGEADRFPEDIPVMIASLILAGSVFLPWYKISRGTGTATATGWETGTWGPMILFLGVLSFLLAVLRRSGRRVGLPVPDTYVHEGAGWLSLIGAIIKLRLAPKTGGTGVIPHQMGTQPWLMVPTIVSAFGLAFLAGRMSGSVPLVTIPGWFRGKAGKLGFALLLVAIGGAAAFGTLNNVDVQELATGRPSTPQGKNPSTNPNPNIITGRFPNCAGTFPKPADAKPVQGVEPTTSPQGPTPCLFFFSSKQTVEALVKFYKPALTKAGYVYKEVPGTSAGKTFQLTKPTCGSLTIQRSQGAPETTLTVILGQKCPSPGSSPRSAPPGGAGGGSNDQFAPGPG